MPTPLPPIEAKLRGNTRPANDSWIAACCLANNLTPATLNTKDFADHNGLTLLTS
jgi:predicted nucleic acid-binding protein